MRRLYVLAVALVAALACTGATALAKSSHSSKAKVPVTTEGAGCGAEAYGARVGVVTYKRTGNEVSLVYKLRHAEPSATYFVALWAARPSECEVLKESEAVTTNKHGDATIKLQDAVPAQETRFFAATYEPGGEQTSFSDAVELP